MILDRFKVTDQVAVVTGAGLGIGRGIAIALAYSATRQPFAPYSYQVVSASGPAALDGPRGFGSGDHDEDAGGSMRPDLRGGIF